jgi:hypothetical protein
MWRHATPEEFARAVAKIEVERTYPDKLVALIRNCVANGHEEAAATLYRSISKRFGSMSIEKQLRLRIGFDAAAEEIRRLERIAAS